MRRSMIEELVTQTRRALFGRCAYCGRHCYGAVCDVHRDLPQIDPLFNPGTTTGQPHPTSQSSAATPDRR